jgi:hypothetical protein
MYVLVGTTVGDFVGNLWMTWLKPLYMTLLESWSEPLSDFVGVFVGDLVGTTIGVFIDWSLCGCLGRNHCQGLC